MIILNVSTYNTTLNQHYSNGFSDSTTHTDDTSDTSDPMEALSLSHLVLNHTSFSSFTEQTVQLRSSSGTKMLQFM